MNALIIFIKNPEKGKVKTRLAQAIGQDAALKIYLELLKHTRQVASEVSAERYLFYSQFIDQNDIWPEALFHKKLQQGNDLGEKMTNAFSQTFEDHNKVVIIGSDCATLTSDIVANAFQELDQVDFVMGPAMDGGYYLLGMRNFYPQVFQKIAWSTEKVGTTTLSRIKELEKTYSLLPTLSDIDHQEDWEKYGWKI